MTLRAGQAMRDVRFLFLILIVAALVLGSRFFFADRGFHELASHAAGQDWIEATKRVLAKFDAPQSVTWAINPGKKADRVSIFVFDSALGASRRHKGLSGNCSYMGDGRTIACDVALIRKISEFYDLDKVEKTRVDPESGYIVARWVEQRKPEEMWASYESLLTWALAHELGHLLSGHTGQFFFAEHKAAENFDIRNDCHQIEFEADSYAVKLLDKQELEELYLFVYHLINMELQGLACPGKPKVSYCENVYPGTGLTISDDMIEYVLSGTHPTYGVRLLRIGQLAQQVSDFGLLAYQLDQLIETRMSVLAPAERGDRCVLN